MAADGEVTRLLRRLGDGDDQAFDRLVPLLYGELRRIARENLRGERADHTLETTALVHEAYVRMLGSSPVSARDRAQFFGATSLTMRRILVDYARARQRLKRGGGATPVPLEEAEAALTQHQASEILALDEALERLALADARAAKVVQLRFFGGLNMAETAAALDIAERTVRRDWISARAWLRKEVSPASAATTTESQEPALSMAGLRDDRRQDE